MKDLIETSFKTRYFEPFSIAFGLEIEVFFIPGLELVLTKDCAIAFESTSMKIKKKPTNDILKQKESFLIISINKHLKKHLKK